MKKPLYIVFLWHMHQPYYKEEKTGEISMPWVRLHAIKDYLDMLEILLDFPDVRQTFNFSPSLLDQIDECVKTRGAGDKFLKISRRHAGELDESEQDFILLNFFMANWETMVKRHLRYYDLLVKRGRHFVPHELPRIRKRFSPQDYLDLQVWFNLVWFDPVYQQGDKVLKEIISKGSYFTEEDKNVVLDKQFEIMTKIIPSYRKLQENRQIEISVSPYYHPILPLLCDLNVARRPSPAIHLPDVVFSHPEDAHWHINEGVQAYEKYFGRRPLGMWPSEGSVSEEVIPLFSEAGISWIATDEELLFRSSDHNIRRESLYRPYSLISKDKPFYILFRDKYLSDAIGFRYHSMPVKDAVADFLKGLHKIKESLPSDDNRPHLVTIILDGENAWEYYPQDGGDFLRSLYQSLSGEKDLSVVTISDFLRLQQEVEGLRKLYSGSWIKADFKIWIGHPEKNKAWEYLAHAREALVEYSETHPGEEEKLKLAWKIVHLAEGSDWNWWFGDDHTSANDEEFDRLYRSQLSYLYELLGKEPPEEILFPIKGKREFTFPQPIALLKPILDGIDTHYYEWTAAGYLDVNKEGGTMQRAESIVRYIYYGFDMENFFLRLDMDIPPQEEYPHLALRLDFPMQKKRAEFQLSKSGKLEPVILFEGSSHSGWSMRETTGIVVFKDILELGIKFSGLGIKNGDKFAFTISILSGKVLLERWPLHREIYLTSPTSDYETLFWNA